jgi:hypothetical protein
MKAAMGCAVGCGALVVVSLLAAGAGAWWFVRPDEQHPTAAVMSPDAGGAFHVGDLGADAGTIALLDRVVSETQRQRHQGLPPWMAEMQRFGSRTSSPSAGFRLLLPREATVSLETSREGRDGAVIVAFNPRGMTRLLRLMMSGSSATGHYRGHGVGRLGDGAWASLVDGTIVFATEESALRAGIDRLAEGGVAPAGPAVDLGSPSRSWDVTGTVANGDGGAERLLWDDREAPAGILHAAFGVDLATGDLLAGRVVAACESPAAAERTLEALRARLVEKARELAARGLELRAALRTEETRAILDWEVHGIDAAITRWVHDHAHSATPPGPGDAAATVF